ncbi:MAG: biopolymer transporter ExbD [Deltaproteobacteria bacterium]|nr:biopolymer transporter ExbD [Deltaproteobacteria bacterium]
MNFGSKRPRGFDARIEIAPLIDVVFLLLIFFLLTTSFVQHRTLGVELPTTRGERSPEPSGAIVLVLREEGSLLHEGRLLDEAGVAALLSGAAAASPPSPIVLQADESVPHGRVVEVLDRIQRAGLRHLSIATKADEKGL